MIEIRWHGRGGQGAKTISQILARINLRQGLYAQAFPEFGPERSGAPVRAYNRIADKQIVVHAGVYNPDIVVVIDDSLLASENPTAGLKPDGVLVVNTPCLPEDIRRQTGFTGKIVTVDAEKIAKETGTGFANVPMLGAVVAVLGADLELTIDELRQALGERMSGAVLQKNLDGFRAGYLAAKEVYVAR